MIKINVIVPVYKVEPYLYRCVNSILSQIFNEFILYLVDDGSTDNSGILCDEFVVEDERLFVIHQMNGGLSAARNSGIDLASSDFTSEWLTFIDSDDWVHPNYLKDLYNAVIETHTLIARAGMRTVFEQIPYDDRRNCHTDVLEVEKAYVNEDGLYTYAWGQLYHKSLFQNVRYPVGRLYEDIAVYHHILFQTDKISIVDFPEYFYFQNNEGIQRQRWNPQKLDEFWSREQALKYLEKHVSKGTLLKVWNSYVYTCDVYLNTITREYKGSAMNKLRYLFCVSLKIKYGVLKCELLDAKYHKTHFKYVRRAFPFITGCYICFRKIYA